MCTFRCAHWVTFPRECIYNGYYIELAEKRARVRRDSRLKAIARQCRWTRFFAGRSLALPLAFFLSPSSPPAFAPPFLFRQTHSCEIYSVEYCLCTAPCGDYVHACLRHLEGMIRLPIPITVWPVIHRFIDRCIQCALLISPVTAVMRFAWCLVHGNLIFTLDVPQREISVFLLTVTFLISHSIIIYHEWWMRYQRELEKNNCNKIFNTETYVGASREIALLF